MFASYPQPQKDSDLKSQEHITLCLHSYTHHRKRTNEKELGMKNALTTKNGSIGLNINVDFLLNSHYSDQVLKD